MASSSTQTAFKFNGEVFKSKIRSEMYVDFTTTQDGESREILRLLEDSGLRVFYSKKSSRNKTLYMLGIEFLVHGEILETGVETRVNVTHHLSITKSTLSQIFKTHDEGVNPLVYKEEEWAKSSELMARNSCKGVRKELKKYLLRRKYRLLMTILTKSNLGEQSSHDGLSKPRLCCMRAILDGVKVDWTGLFFNRLKEEKGIFALVGDEWTANSVVSLFNKITLILEAYSVAADWNVGVRKYTK